MAVTFVRLALAHRPALHKCLQHGESAARCVHLLRVSSNVLLDIPQSPCTDLNCHCRLTERPCILKPRRQQQHYLQLTAHIAGAHSGDYHSPQQQRNSKVLPSQVKEGMPWCSPTYACHCCTLPQLEHVGLNNWWSCRLILLDAFALLYRAHFGLKDVRLATTTGEDTSILFAFLRSLLALLELEPPPTHFAVVFDAAGKTFRLVGIIALLQGSITVHIHHAAFTPVLFQRCPSDLPAAQQPFCTLGHAVALEQAKPSECLMQ